MKVIIFTEGGNNIGLGHISRCSSLYNEILSRGIDASYIVYGNINETNLIKDIKICNDNWFSKDYLINFISSNDYCIVDSYLASEALIEIISSKAKKVLFIDDTARIKYPKGIVVNPSLYVDDCMYHTNDDNTYLLGNEYIILRCPFINVTRDIINTNITEVLITVGGTDIRNLIPEIICKICKNYNDIKFNIITNDTKNKELELKNVKIYNNIEAEMMKKLMLKSDFAITAAGQTIYELIATQTPFIPIKIIENQSNNIKGLKKFYPNLVDIKYDDEFFMKNLEKEFNLMFNLKTRIQLINLFPNIIDGFGSKRIIDELLK